MCQQARVPRDDMQTPHSNDPGNHKVQIFLMWYNSAKHLCRLFPKLGYVNWKKKKKVCKIWYDGNTLAALTKTL